jgi:hypothetical protein
MRKSGAIAVACVVSSAQRWSRAFDVHRHLKITDEQRERFAALYMDSLDAAALNDEGFREAHCDIFKRRYDATFANEFIGEGNGTRYKLTARVRLRWPYRFAAPLLKPLVVARMRRYVVEPLKAAAEAER